MTDKKLPWSVPVRTSAIGRELKRHLVADEAVRARVARSLDLASLDRLEADMLVTPAATGWTVSGRLRADLAQTCGITLEPLPATVDVEFSTRCVDEADAEALPEELEVSIEDADPPDVIEGGVIDLGAYAVEYLTLELDPFPRKPGVEFVPPEQEPEPSPFAALAALKRGTGES